MKRLLVVILSFVYLSATTGTTLYMHYCMGKLADFSLSAKNQDKQCGKCGMEKSDMPNGCCEDQHKWIKIQDDQKSSFTSFTFAQWQLDDLQHPSTFHWSLFFTESADLLSNSHAPPRSCEIDIYKRNCVFRI